MDQRGIRKPKSGGNCGFPVWWWLTTWNSSPVGPNFPNVKEQLEMKHRIRPLEPANLKRL